MIEKNVIKIIKPLNNSIVNNLHVIQKLVKEVKVLDEKTNNFPKEQKKIIDEYINNTITNIEKLVSETEKMVKDITSIIK
jgi:hypothetical protein